MYQTDWPADAPAARLRFTAAGRGGVAYAEEDSEQPFSRKWYRYDGELYWYSDGPWGNGATLQVVAREGDDVVLEDQRGMRWRWRAQPEAE